MTEPRTGPRPPGESPGGGVDLERIALQIDGRIPGEDASAYLDGLSDEDLALFAEAAAVTRELEEEDGIAPPAVRRDETETDAPAAPFRAERAHAVDAETVDRDAEDGDDEIPGVTPIHRARRSWGTRGWMAAAAVIAAAVIVPLVWQASRGRAVQEPAQAVAMLENPAAGLPRGWTDTPAWAVTRGEGDARTDNARAARLGAYLVQLELALRARQPEAGLLALRAAELLDNVPAGGIASSMLRDLAGRADQDPAAALADLDGAAGAASQMVDADWLALGAWAEAARLAAARRDAAFFGTARTRSTLDRAETLLAGDAEAQTALTAIRASVQSDTPDFTQLGPALRGLRYAAAS